MPSRGDRRLGRLVGGCLGLLGLSLYLFGIALRGVGPVLATWFYGGFIETYTKRGGYNGAIIFNVVFMAVALLPLGCYLELLYGKFSDPSPAAKRKEAEDSKAMM